VSGHAHHGPPSAPSAVAVTPPATAKAPEISSLKLLATLAIGGAAAGLLVVAVYKATLPTIEKYEAAKVAGAVREVLKAPARWDTLYLQKGVLTKSPTSGDDRKGLPTAYLGFDAAGKRLGVAVTAAEVTTAVAPTHAPLPEFVPGAPPPATLSADIWRGIAAENPVLVQMLGMCPTMAVTNVLANGIAMGVATTFVLVGSGLFVSLFRKYIAYEVRITSYILIIATFVTLADLLLAASFPEISKALGPFIPLIVANCLLLGRAEAFAAKVGPVRAVADGMGMGIGFTLALMAMSAIRELLGRGSLLGFDILGPRWEPWVFMVLPPGGFFTLGLLLIAAAWIDEGRRRRRALEAK